MRRKQSITIRELQAEPSEMAQKLESIAKAQAKKAIKEIELAYGIIDPDYARIFTMARCLAWSEGYALLFHGSFTRDLDLIAVPWTSRACEPGKLIRRVAQATDLEILNKSNSEETKDGSPKEHGRLAWTMVFKTFGDPRFIDFSIMPRIASPVGEQSKP